MPSKKKEMMQSKLITNGEIQFKGAFTIRQLLRAVIAFKLLMDRRPEIFIKGSPYDQADLDCDFWPNPQAHVIDIGKKYLTVGYHGDVFQIFCPNDSPYADLRDADNYSFLLK